MNNSRNQFKVNTISIDERKNSLLSEKTVINDAKFWIPLIETNHFTWLSDEDKEKVVVPKTLEEFWDLSPVHQDHVLAAWWILFRKGRKQPRCAIRQNS